MRRQELHAEVLDDVSLRNQGSQKEYYSQFGTFSLLATESPVLHEARQVRIVNPPMPAEGRFLSLVTDVLSSGHNPIREG